MYLIQNRKHFTDDIATYINYPGDAAKKITFEDPDTNQLISLDFTGNPILRESAMIYANGGYFHVDDPVNPTSLVYKYAGYEGVRSFAIVTTKVTDEILQYWLDQKDEKDENGALLYPEGPMKAAYGTFLEALLVIYGHDMVADVAASKYNVTWSRTTSIVVSGVDDATSTYITGEMSHRMGMDVVGDPENVRAFRYACSSAFSPIEYWVGQALFPSSNSTSDLLGSVTLGLGYMMLNGEPLEIFESNGYTIIRAIGDNQRILIIDPLTGIVMDGMFLNEIISGTRCFGDQQTEWAHDYGNSLLDNKDAIKRAMETGEDVCTDYGQGSDEWKDEALGLAGSALISIGVAALPFLIAAGPVGWIAAAGLIGAGLACSWFASDMDEDMWSPSNQINFALNVGPSFIPFVGWEGSVGGKLAVKTLTSKGVSRELFNIPKNYEGYVVQTVRSMGPDYAKGPLTGGSITSARYIKYGSPEGVVRIAFGWTPKEAALNAFKYTYLPDRAAYVIDRYSDDIDGAFGYKKYNSTEEYLATV